VASAAVVVDAKDDPAKRFYEHFDFAPENLFRAI